MAQNPYWPNLPMKPSALVFALSLACATVAYSQKDQTVPVRQLELSSTHELPTPPFRYMGNVQCDENGLMYFLLGSGFDVSVMRLNPRTGEPVLFTDNQKGTYLREWYSRDRTVTAMTENDLGSKFAVAFDSDGNVTHRTKLDLPAGFYPTGFVALPSGALFIEGYVAKSEESPGEKGAGAYLLNPNGSVLRKIDLPTVAGRQGEDGGFVKVGGATFADGYLYVLGADKLFMFSEAGQLIDKIALKKPEEDMRPRRAMVSDGTIAIEYTQVEGGKDIGKIISTYVLLHGAPPELLGIYRPSDQLNNRAACFEHGEFSFIRFSSGRVIVRTSQLR